jgi:hypothetical protein
MTWLIAFGYAGMTILAIYLMLLFIVWVIDGSLYRTLLLLWIWLAVIIKLVLSGSVF